MQAAPQKAWSGKSENYAAGQRAFAHRAHMNGLASLGQAAYLAVGAYATAILATKYHFGLGWDFWLVLLIGILLGYPCLRVRGPYFVILTFGVAGVLGQCGYNADGISAT